MTLHNLDKFILVNIVGKGFLKRLRLLIVKMTAVMLHQKKAWKLREVTLNVILMMATLLLINNAYDFVKFNSFISNLEWSSEVKIVQYGDKSNLVDFTYRSTFCVFNKSTLDLNCVKWM